MASSHTHGDREGHNSMDVYEEVGDSDGDLSTSDEDVDSWVSWYCGLKGNEFFCEVEDAFIQDSFNLAGLSSQVPFYELALDVIQDLESPGEDELRLDQKDMVENAAEMLYGLIHARFILTSRGMHCMREKFLNVDFGRCHRVFCEGQPVLPVGQSDVLRHTTVNVFCPKCKEIYFPKSSRHGNIDGAYFGTSFPHLFLMAFPQFCIDSASNRNFVPRVYGFKIQSSSPYFQPSKIKNRKETHRRRRKKKDDIEDAAEVAAGNNMKGTSGGNSPSNETPTKK